MQAFLDMIQSFSSEVPREPQILLRLRGDFLLTVLHKPQYRSAQILDSLRRGYDCKNFIVIDHLERYGLRGDKMRASWVSSVSSSSANLAAFIEEVLCGRMPPKPQDLYELVREIPGQWDGPRWKAVLLHTCELLRRNAKQPRPWLDSLEKTAYDCDFAQAQKFIRSILELDPNRETPQRKPVPKDVPKDRKPESATAAVPMSQKTSQPVIPKTPVPIAPGTPAEPPAQQDFVKTLKDENAQLQYLWSMEQRRVKEMEEKLRTAESDGKVEVFRAMVATPNGSVLDELAKAAKAATEMDLDAPTIETLRMIQRSLRLFTDFIRRYGLVSMEEVGAIKELTLADADAYDYSGSHFEEDDERKRVVVRTSGWRYGEEVIVRPRVYEVET